MPVKINREQWSNSSRISSEWGYLYQKEIYYENITYHCVKCLNAAVFYAEDQKFSYEVHKKIIRYIPRLCPLCQAEYSNLKEKTKSFQDSWNTNKEALKNDKDFLSTWLSTIKEIEIYGKRIDYSKKPMLIRLLRENFHNEVEGLSTISQSF